jgi:hypothetical protein
MHGASRAAVQADAEALDALWGTHLSGNESLEGSAGDARCITDWRRRCK